MEALSPYEYQDEDADSLTAPTLDRLLLWDRAGWFQTTSVRTRIAFALTQLSYHNMTPYNMVLS